MAELVEMLRLKVAQKASGLGRTAFHEVFVKSGKLKFFKVGPRSTACLKSDFNRVLMEIAAGAGSKPEDKPRTSSGRYRSPAADDAA